MLILHEYFVKFSCGFAAKMTHKERGFVFLSGLGAAQAA
jgi:hypothetical protein